MTPMECAPSTTNVTPAPAGAQVSYPHGVGRDSDDRLVLVDETAIMHLSIETEREDDGRWIDEVPQRHVRCIHCDRAEVVHGR